MESSFVKRRTLERKLSKISVSSTIHSNKDEKYDEYLKAMVKQTRSQSRGGSAEIMSPRERHRNKESVKQAFNESDTLEKTTRVSIIASMVPDEIINEHSDHSVRRYETALMFIDVSGFTELCETYTKAGRGGPSRLTQVLNSYIGAMVQEILSQGGDVLNFSGDAFLSMWKKSSSRSMQDVVHTAIDCGLSIQKNYGTYHTDVGVILKVKVAISAGISHFSIIGGVTQSHYVIVGQPVWDVKMAEVVSTAGDVLTSASAWMYVNAAEYYTQPSNDGRHTKVLGVGVAWKRVEKIEYGLGLERDSGSSSYKKLSPRSERERTYYREFSLRPAVVSAIRSSWWPMLRQFMVKPVLRAVDNDEPMEFLAEVRRVVIVFLNIITKSVSEELLIRIVDSAYKIVCSVFSASGGLVNKVSMFDKDMMFLVVFGLRGLKHEDEAQKALQCALTVKESLSDSNIISVSVGITSGTTYCGVVGHVLRREYTVIGSAVNKAARLMMAYPSKICCDKETFLRSKLDQEYFWLLEPKPLKGIQEPGPVYEFNKFVWPERLSCWRHPILGRNEELRKYKMALYNAIKQQHQKFTRYRDHIYGIVFIVSFYFILLIARSQVSQRTTLRYLRGMRSVVLRRDVADVDFLTSVDADADITKLTSADAEGNADVRLGIVKGPEAVGKTRLLEECITATPKCIPVHRIRLNQAGKKTYGLFRQTAMITMTGSDGLNAQQKCENKIRANLDIKSLEPVQVYGINTLFGCRFAIPANFDYSGDIIAEQSIKTVVREIFQNTLNSLCIVAIEKAIFADDESWRLLLILMEAKSIFLIMNICDDTSLSEVAYKCLSNNMLIKVRLGGIERWYHAALACQLLDVQAIPADLEKVIQSASDGMPGWIQNFVISLVQRGALSIVTVTRAEALRAGAVLPPPSLLSVDKPVEYDNLKQWMDAGFQGSNVSLGEALYKSNQKNLEQGADIIQMAVLADAYNFEDMKVDMAMDAVILKTYDSLTPFEKMLLKCSSVLGEVFSRRMLEHVLQSDSLRKVAQAVAKLFLIRVLECEGGDFTRDASMVLVHPAPVPVAAKPPYCACLGIRQLPDCRDLPAYAFCGYMKFKHPLFRTTTYDLLTESQKLEMHARALLYLERFTRRCIACGAGCYYKLLGERCNDGLIKESKELRKTRCAIRALAAETLVAGEQIIVTDDQSDLAVNLFRESSMSSCIPNEERIRLRESTVRNRKAKHVRSFSSLDLASCECLSIILSVYCQLIEHCRGAGEYGKLFEAYLEYADLCVMNSNIPQAVRLLFEVEAFAMSEKYCDKVCKISWFKSYRLGRILSLRGACMLESGDLTEARKHLFRALELYYDPFPLSNYGIKLRNAQLSVRQLMSLYVAPQLYEATESGVAGVYYEDIAETLNRLFKLFSECKEVANASLAAKWALDYALQSGANFRLLCDAYGNMITIYRKAQKFSKCLRLEKRAMELCHRKRGQLDITEVRSVCFLYTSLFLFYVEYGKKKESLEFGLSVMHMITNQTDLNTRHLLILWMLKMLLTDLRIADMVVLMREFFYLSDHYDLSSITWYHFYSIVILLDTGFCVESYQTCEKFYIKKGDAILRSKNPDAAWYFFVSMWLMTIRMGAWERTILWEDKIKHVTTMDFRQSEFNLLLLVRLVEGLLIMLVREIDNRNIKKIVILEKTVKNIFQDMNKSSGLAPLYRPRYYLLFAYYHYIRGKRFRAFSYLNKTVDLAKQFSHGTILIWAEHTRKHWKGILNPALVDYWVEHVEPDNLLDYRDFNPTQGKQIIPYTLPLPRDFAI